MSRSSRRRSPCGIKEGGRNENTDHCLFHGVGHVFIHPVPGKNLGRKSTALAAGVSAAYRAACRRDLGIGRISYRTFRKTSGRLRRNLGCASVSAHRLYSPGRLHGLLRRDLVPAGFSDTAEDFEGLACRVVCRRVYDFPDARHVRSLPGFQREKRLLGADSDSGLFALCLELLRVRLPPDADEPVRVRI